MPIEVKGRVTMVTLPLSYLQFSAKSTGSGAVTNGNRGSGEVGEKSEFLSRGDEGERWVD